MGQTKVGIIYATGSKLHRGVVSPADDAELDNPAKWCGPGESLLIVDQTEVADKKLSQTNIPSIDVVASLLVDKIGTPAHSGRCCVVDKAGNVVNVIVADPAIDTLKDYTLILDENAGPGWNWTEKGGFVDLRPPPPEPTNTDVDPPTK